MPYMLLVISIAPMGTVLSRTAFLSPYWRPGVALAPLPTKLVIRHLLILFISCGLKMNLEIHQSLSSFVAGWRGHLFIYSVAGGGGLTCSFCLLVEANFDWMAAWMGI